MFQKIPKRTVERVLQVPPEHARTYAEALRKRKESMEGTLSQSPSSGGLTAFKKHLEQQFLTQRQRILAACAECLGFYQDGREDCQCPGCPLYPLMPYGIFRKKRIKREKINEPEKSE